MSCGQVTQAPGYMAGDIHLTSISNVYEWISGAVTALVLVEESQSQGEARQQVSADDVSVKDT
jgi:hypothetical protein